MKLFDAFSRQAPNKVFFSILLGALSGICYALLIPIVLSAISEDPASVVEYESTVRTVLSYDVSDYKVATLFLIVCVFILVTRTLSQVILTRVSIDLSTEMRIGFYKRIMAASTDVLEKMGSAKLLATITTDVGRIVSGARMLPDVLINSVTIIGLLGFLIYLNINVFWFVIGAITFGVITYQLPILLSNAYLSHSRKKVDDLLEAINGLIYGNKELKLNDVKSRIYLDEVLTKNEHDVRDAEKTGNTITRAAANYGDMISFFVIGIVTFIFINYESMSSDELVGVVMALLYITGPVSIVINSIPQIIVSRVSLNKVNKIFQEIPPENINHDVFPLEDWQEIRFSQVGYQYPERDGLEGFKIGPIDFTIEKGQITFIVGGNGSGKSTLSKLLTLHHQPSSGTISFGNTVVDSHSIKSVRQSISSIYSDYYLFNRLLTENGESEEALKIQQDEIDVYLKELGLDDKVTIKNGEFSTISLSDGQKRRLALLVAFLEDKEFYLFDEWAADQDPIFKEFFYYHILPQLKAKGKAVVAISHDDRYFDVADKILVMESGSLIDCITEREIIDERTKTRNIVSTKKVAAQT
ncbi:cyclic peptide export ABC transporter [Pseudoalteromonas sp. JBTF-M23]|uniref:Cyclic peptide export ABC transporter n=1 Tax=Pseudoalteromonas caenipelagi TaxID=2726988 RepID=A0A849VDX6_9GAMM|nr:cyclic peptide export ABC transporter [Pseudoalteromonas caenipelagi]NOU51325.1 cyclic peptide export ABC transporter [Pseudoalteromonas caenipelagi]